MQKKYKLSEKYFALLEEQFLFLIEEKFKKLKTIADKIKVVDNLRNAFIYDREMFLLDIVIPYQDYFIEEVPFKYTYKDLKYGEFHSTKDIKFGENETYLVETDDNEHGEFMLVNTYKSPDGDIEFRNKYGEIFDPYNYFDAKVCKFKKVDM